MSGPMAGLGTPEDDEFYPFERGFFVDFENSFIGSEKISS